MLKKEVIDLKKRNGLRKALIGGAVIGVGVIGLSGLASAVPQLNIRSADGVKGSVIQGVNTKRITVSATEPVGAESGDVWINNS